jgi:hypothetical protein
MKCGREQAEAGGEPLRLQFVASPLIAGISYTYAVCHTFAEKPEQ